MAALLQAPLPRGLVAGEWAEGGKMVRTVGSFFEKIVKSSVPWEGKFLKPVPHYSYEI
jgi:hypothetical protein